MFGKTVRMLMIALAVMMGAMAVVGCQSTGGTTGSDGHAGHSH